MQRKTEWASVFAVNLAKHELAIFDGGNHGAGLKRAPGLTTSHVAAVAVAPFIKSGFDRLVGQRVQLAGFIAALRLQRHTLGADDVLAAHTNERAGVVVPLDRRVHVDQLGGGRLADPLVGRLDLLQGSSE